MYREFASFPININRNQTATPYYSGHFIPLKSNPEIINRELSGNASTLEKVVLVVQHGRWTGD
jgi:hypothetical protein